jgi:hypothetical protein
VSKVDYYIEKQDLEISLIVSTIRDIILSCAVQIQESIKYKIPFYSYHSNICYINVRKKTVDLGFVNGANLSNHQGLLEVKDRVSVKTISFQNVSEIDESILREIIFEAIMLDEIKISNKKKLIQQGQNSINRTQ